MVQFRVNFDDGKGFYYPGENITGLVTVSLRERIKFRELAVTFIGKSFASYSRDSGNHRSCTSSVHKGEYFKEDLMLVSALSPSNDNVLDPGEFSFPFNFQLPNNIPPTFTFHKWGDRAYIKYKMKIAFKITGTLKSNVVEEIPIVVESSPIDSSHLLHLLKPGKGATEKFLCCLCCQSGPIVIRSQINKQIFYAGETIVFDVELDNRETSKTLGNVEAKLVKRVMIMNNSNATHHSTESSVIIAQNFSPGGHEVWQNCQLNLPGQLLPNFDNCECVDVTYKFVVQVGIPGGINAKAKIPVTISAGVLSREPQAQPGISVTGTQSYPRQGNTSSLMSQDSPAPPIVTQP